MPIHETLDSVVIGCPKANAELIALRAEVADRGKALAAIDHLIRDVEPMSASVFEVNDDCEQLVRVATEKIKQLQAEVERLDRAESTALDEWASMDACWNEVRAALGVPDEPLLAAVVAHIEKLRTDAEAGQRSCPCLYGDPCSSECACVNEFSSVACNRCCKYGSDEQRARMAKRIIGDLEAGRRLPLTADGVRVVQDELVWVRCRGGQEIQVLVSACGVGQGRRLNFHVRQDNTEPNYFSWDIYSTLEALRAAEKEAIDEPNKKR